jgi:hypothetical protein
MNIRQIGKFVVEGKSHIQALDFDGNCISYSSIKGGDLNSPEDLKWICDALNDKLQKERQNTPIN